MQPAQPSTTGDLANEVPPAPSWPPTAPWEPASTSTAAPTAVMAQTAQSQSTHQPSHSHPPVSATEGVLPNGSIGDLGSRRDTSPHGDSDSRGNSELPRESESLTSVLASHHQAWRLESVNRELSATREELDAMRSLLEKLPEIFEQRFNSRIEPLMKERELLLSETNRLRQHLLELTPNSGSLPLPSLPPASTTRSHPITEALRHAFAIPSFRQHHPPVISERPDR